MEDKPKKAKNFRNYKVWQDAEELYNNLLVVINDIERQINGLISTLRNS